MSPSWRPFLAWLVPCAVLLLVLEQVLRPNTRERNVELFTEMAYSKAYESLSPSPGLPGGLTQQALVEGVVVRGQMPFRFGPGADEARRAGSELANPIADAPDVRARGALLFKRFCVVCHAADGGGQGPVVQRGVLPPPSLHAARSVQMQDGEMFHILTMGQGNMGSYAAQLAVDDRWNVIRHVRSLQEASQ